MFSLKGVCQEDMFGMIVLVCMLLLFYIHDTYFSFSIELLEKSIVMVLFLLLFFKV